jgi:putative membrane protein
MTRSEEAALTAPDGSQQRALQRLGAGHERRLHPLSWLFVLLSQLRQFALPLIAFVVFGQRADEDELWFQAVALAAALLLTFAAVARFYTYRFRIDAGVLVIRSGLLHRNLRQIPLARIQNVALKQNPLHRLLGVAEVKLESAVGGGTPEAQMQVLSLADAHALELVVEASGGGEAAAEGDAHPASKGTSADAEASQARAAPPSRVLLALPIDEVIKLGLTSNRGLVLGAVGFGAFSQFGGEGFGAIAANAAKAGVDYASGLGLGWLQWLLLGAALLLGFLVLARLLAVILVLLQLFGFKLSETGSSLGVESGLLTRTRTRAPLAKIQRWSVFESLVHRWLGRQSVSVETAALQATNEQQALTDVIPIAPPQRVDALLRHWLPTIDWGRWQWQPLHPRAWRRMVWPSLLVIVAITVTACRKFGLEGLFALLLLVPLAVWRARLLARRCGYVLTDQVLAWRSGWLDRTVSFAEVHRLQGLRLTQSPFDRRHGMASLYADTAGASPLTHALHLRHLPEAQARALFEEISVRIARQKLRW